MSLAVANTIFCIRNCSPSSRRLISDCSLPDLISHLWNEHARSASSSASWTNGSPHTHAPARCSRAGNCSSACQVSAHFTNAVFLRNFLGFLGQMALHVEMIETGLLHVVNKTSTISPGSTSSTLVKVAGVPEAHGKPLFASSYEPRSRVDVVRTRFYCGCADTCVAGTSCSDGCLPPICVPMISPEMMISTRRFCCRPLVVSLLATGLDLP